MRHYRFQALRHYTFAGFTLQPAPEVAAMFLYTPTDAQCRIYWAVLAIVFSLALLALSNQPAHAQNRYGLPEVQPPSKTPVWRNGLPPTMLDSFVYEAMEMRDYIYGDEGVFGPPPYDEYTAAHRIDAGILDGSRVDTPGGPEIMDKRASGLTTGHGAWMPDGVGADEFVGNEWSYSGAAARPYSAYNPVIFKNPESNGTDGEFPLGEPSTYTSQFNPLKENPHRATEHLPQYDLGEGYVPGHRRDHERHHG